MPRAPLSPNALRVLERRYLLRDARGGLAEDPAGLFRRVARGVAAAERRLGSPAGRARRAAEWAERFEVAMTSLEFLPNSPCLMNAGTPRPGTKSPLTVSTPFSHLCVACDLLPAPLSSIRSRSAPFLLRVGSE